MAICLRSTAKRSILHETVILTGLCLLDTLLTVIVIGLGTAYEANPMFKAALDQGMECFVLVKIASFIVPLLVIEAIREMTPRFIKISLRLGIVGYLAVYTVGSLMVNGKLPFYTP